MPIYDKKAQAKGLAKAAKVGLKGVIFAGVSAADIESAEAKAAEENTEPANDNADGEQKKD